MIRRGSSTAVAKELHKKRVAFKQSLDFIVPALEKVIEQTNERMEEDNNQRDKKTLDNLRGKMKNCLKTLEFCKNTLRKM